MLNHVVKVLKSVKERVGIDSAAYTCDGNLIYRTQDARLNDFSFSREEKNIVQPVDENVTVVPVKGGITVVLQGVGEEFLTYGALIRTAIEDTYTEPKNEPPLPERLKMYLKGELDSDAASELIKNHEGTFDCYVLTLVTDSARKCAELNNFLETMREYGDMIIPAGDKSVAFIKSCGEDDEYQSATDFAYTLYDNIKEELRINVVINVGGTVHSFADLPEFYKRGELAYIFGSMMTPGEKVYSYKEYIMIKMLSDIPVESLSRYLDTLMDKDSNEIIKDPELMNTAEEFMKNSLNISETSREMYMHRNTLIYRLDKIEKATGLNLRHFNDAMAFKLLITLDKLVKNKLNGDKNGL